MDIALERIRNWIPGTDLHLSGLGLFFLPPLPATLTRLSCFSNQLTSLPALPATLTELSCYNNQLTSLPALPATLTTLYCFNNQLTLLSALPATLKTLSCDNNQLTSLPALPATLILLNCNNNQLPSLPPLPATLVFLYCSKNQFPDRVAGESISAFQERLLVWDQENSRKRVQEATLRFKEELMRNRWHPARMDAYLEMGLDLADM